MGDLSASSCVRPTAGAAPRCCATAGRPTSMPRCRGPSSSSTSTGDAVRRARELRLCPPPGSTAISCSPSCWPGDGRLLERLRSQELLPSAAACACASLSIAPRPRNYGSIWNTVCRRRRYQADGPRAIATLSITPRHPCAHEHPMSCSPPPPARSPADRREAVPGDLRRSAAANPNPPRDGADEPAPSAAYLSPGAEESRWLVTGLWVEQARRHRRRRAQMLQVRSLHSTSPSAVAAGIRALRRFAVPRAGRCCSLPPRMRCISYASASTSAAAGMALAGLDIQVITAPSVRLDSMPTGATSRRPSPAAAALAHPRSLRASASHRRECQQRGRTLLAFCASCSDAMPSPSSLSTTPRRALDAPVRTGTARSSEFHAWGDSNLYLRRQAETSSLGGASRRAIHAACLARTCATRRRPRTRIIDRRSPVTPASNSLDERITTALAETGQHCRSPIYVLAAASVPLLSTSGSQLLLTAPHRQGRRRLSPHQLLIAAITMRMAPAPRCFPLPVLSTACGNGNWEVHQIPRFHAILRFGPSGAILLRPPIPKPARAVAVKTRPASGRRRLGLTAASTAAD